MMVSLENSHRFLSAVREEGRWWVGFQYTRVKKVGLFGVLNYPTQKCAQDTVHAFERLPGMEMSRPIPATHREEAEQKISQLMRSDGV